MPSGPFPAAHLLRAAAGAAASALHPAGDWTKAQVVPRWMADVLRQLDQPKNFICGLPALLSMTSYTQEHLTRSFRKYVHLSPTAYINQKRLGYAAELMVNSGATPPQAAQQAGFHNISHFYHLFHQQYSCTPLQFSAQYRDAQRSQSARLFDISHRAARECAQHNAVRVPLEKGLLPITWTKDSRKFTSRSPTM